MSASRPWSSSGSNLRRSSAFAAKNGCLSLVEVATSARRISAAAVARLCCSPATQKPLIRLARSRPRIPLSKQRWPKPMQALRFRSLLLPPHSSNYSSSPEIFGVTALTRNEADQNTTFTTEDTDVHRVILQHISYQRNPIVIGR